MWDKIVSVGGQILTGDSLRVVLFLLGACIVCAIMLAGAFLQDKCNGEGD